MHSLNGKIALVAGGTGGVGEGIVRQFLRAGATVVVPSRSAARLDALRAYLDVLAADERFVPLVGDIGEPAGAAALRAEVLRRFGRLDAVVASLGGSWRGTPLVETPVDTWEQVLREHVTVHFVAARTLLPVLLQQGAGGYTFIGGPSSEQPAPLAGPQSVAGAAQTMLFRVLVEELHGRGVRINQLTVGPVMTRARGGDGAPPEWVRAEDIGAFAVWLASDEGAMMHGQIVRMTGDRARTWTQGRTVALSGDRAPG